jgi:ketosteroid isomerase-like protein
MAAVNLSRGALAAGRYCRAMAQEDVEVVRGAFAAFENRDLDRLGDLVTEDVSVYRADPDGATAHGMSGFLQLTAEWTEDFTDWTVVPEAFVDAGERVLVRVRQSAQGGASGVPLAEDWWFVFELRGPQVARMSIYSREPDAREAAGLPE